MPAFTEWLNMTHSPPRGARATLLGRKRMRGRKPQVPEAREYIQLDITNPVPHPQQDPIILAGGAVFPAVNVAQLDIQNEVIE